MLIGAVSFPTAVVEFRGVKIFSATMARERMRLGERVTDWIRSNPALRIVRTVVVQSSYRQFHCLSIVVFWNDA